MNPVPAPPSVWQRSTIVRVVRWFFRWRNLRVILFVLFCLVTLVCLFYAEEDWRGWRAWENYRREWEAKGEKFDLVSLAPPPVPEAQNFALTPLLKPIFDFTRDPDRVHWLDTNGCARLQHLRADLPWQGRPSALGNLEKGTFTDLEAWRDFYRGNTNYPQPPSPGTAAADVLVALGKFDPEIQELREAAAKRPDSRFAIEYDYGMPADILLPHLANIKGLNSLVALRAVARLELGQSPQALEELQLGFRLSDSIREEPILIDHLVRVATLGRDLQGVREGLMRHAWSDAQLVELEQYLGGLDLLKESKQALRGERADLIGNLDYLRRQGFRFNAGEFPDHLAPWPGLLRLWPGGWFYQNMLTSARLNQEYLLGAVQPQSHRVFPDLSDRGDLALSTTRTMPYNFFAKFLLPALGTASAKSAQMQTYVDAARVACALERFRLANGRLPDTLAALTPRFLDRIPNDVIDGQPLRYRQTPDGGYVIYSIGWNRKDDGGKVEVTKSGAVDALTGDWVWQCPGRLDR